MGSKLTRPLPSMATAPPKPVLSSYPWGHPACAAAGQAERIRAEVAKAVEDAAAWAAAQPVPKPEDGLRHVFAQGAVPLRNV